MIGEKSHIAIVNRSFWPASQVIGEGLLQVAEKLVAGGYRVSLVTQSAHKLKAEMNRAARGVGVDVRDCKARSNSASHLFVRALDALAFMIWVFVVLCWQRPRIVYVSTDPPIVVPFVVSLYSVLRRAKVVYHLQDIHPEAANVIVPMSSLTMRFFKGADSWSMRRAFRLITLSEDMADVIRSRSNATAPVELLENPALGHSSQNIDRQRGFIYCGNAGRLQRIPLLISAITEYREQGGLLPFEFVGGGVFSSELCKLSEQVSGVNYLGQVSGKVAAERVAAYEWAILSIEDDVTRYAFPSKTSTYAVSGARILAVCGEQTSVAKWTCEHGVGRSCNPTKEELVAEFFVIEKSVGLDEGNSTSLANLEMQHFVDRLSKIIQCAGE